MTLSRPIPRPSRRAAAVLTVTGVGAAALGAVVATTAGAATTTAINYREAVTCSFTASVAPPAARVLATKLLLAAGHTANGTIPIPTSYKDPSTGTTYTVAQWVVQYAAEGLGAHGKVGSFGANVGGQLSRSPIGADIPGRGITITFNASSTPVPYTFQDSGPVPARVSVNTYVGQMTHTDTRTYPGTVCPTGTNAVANINANGPADPTPSASVTPSASKSASTSASASVSPSATATP